LSASTLSRRCYALFASLFFDPRAVYHKARGVPFFVANLVRYSRLNRNRGFRFQASDLLYTSYERFLPAGTARGHYFHQDLWAARQLHRRQLREHVDVGSRIDGFVAHVLTFCRVTYVDLRPLDSQVPGLEFRQGSLLDLPFADDSVSSLSCLHVLEHIGLGRYGDPVDPDGHLKAAAELSRVLRPGGTLLLGTPVGRERLCFDAHRVFDPESITDALRDLDLVDFCLIDDAAQRVQESASFEAARRCDYGCGLFVFMKPERNGAGNRTS
jgi:SAM-dependent methyltransferase